MGSKKRLKTITNKPLKIKKKTTLAKPVQGPKIDNNHFEKFNLLKKLELKNNQKIKLLLHFFNTLPIVSTNSNNIFKKITQKTLNLKIKKQYVTQMSQLKKNKKIKKKNFRFHYLYFLMFFKSLLNLTLANELQTLFLLTSNKQQYFLNTLGINFFLFKTYSSGRCLKSEFGEKTSKGLKKSFKLNKALVEYYYAKALFKTLTEKYTHTYIKPFNKKALVLYNQIQNNSEYYHTKIGFHKYYKINYKRVSRIKKKIKKKLINENFLTKITQ